ncbi:MAG: GNAT family N-acetyltransferase [Clostridia bacterium]|nr:GNAT family N-acetyltransferase [Clostridia bacterium]
MKPKPARIVTERLVLRPLEDGDREALLSMARDSRITATYMIPDFADAAQEDAFFRRMRALSAAETRFVYGISLGGELIGFLNDCGTDGDGIEIGYFISPGHWNRGYATEALRAAIGALAAMGFRRVEAGCFEENPASGRVMEKCGMRPLGRASLLPYRGREHRCLYRGITVTSGAPEERSRAEQ